VLSLGDLPAPAACVDDSGRLSRMNAAMEDFLGGPRANPAAVMLDDLLPAAEAVARWQDFRAHPGIPSRPIEFEIESAAGQTAVLVISRRLDAAGASGFLALIDVRGEDVPAGAVRHPASGDLLHEELRDIALVFSHDLKEPVQQVMRLARQIEDQEHFNPANSAYKWINQIQQCAGRTSNMLDSMLEYLAVSSRESPPTLVDLNESLEQALDNLKAAIDENAAEITSDHLPAVTGDAYQILHLFQNLISNALKFHGHEKPILRIGVAQAGQEWELSFRDNGIGIADNFLGRIFEMGQRLHTHEEYPGTGVGLAICRRIVERHHGQIWARSNDGTGSTFYVRLPRTPSHVARLA
jgi:signal transduction histidine kinase